MSFLKDLFDGVRNKSRGWDKSLASQLFLVVEQARWLNHADFISFYSLLNCAGGGTTKSNTTGTDFCPTLIDLIR